MTKQLNLKYFGPTMVAKNRAMICRTNQQSQQARKLFLSKI